MPTRLVSTTSGSRSGSSSSSKGNEQAAEPPAATPAAEAKGRPKQLPQAQQTPMQQDAPAQQGGWDDDAEPPPVPLDPNVKPPGMAFVTIGAAISAMLAVGVAALGILGTFYAGYAISQIAKELKKPEPGSGPVAAAPATGVGAGSGAATSVAAAAGKGAAATAAGAAGSRAASLQPGAGGGKDTQASPKPVGVQATAPGEGEAAAGRRRGRSCGLCSIGKTAPYVGNVDSNTGLRAALEARSFRREVILMATDSEQLLPVRQAVHNLLRLGLEHVLVMSASGPDCVRVAGAVPSAGCVWLDFELPVFGADSAAVPTAAPMWHNRYRLAARAVRLRYNTFIVDTDAIFFDDPYVYFKSPPFANFTIINQPEVLYNQDDYVNEVRPNGGVLYIQNAAPDGPAAWLLAEVTDRLLRWIEDGFNTTRHTHDVLTWCNYMDQDGLRDAISSVMMGRIFFASAMRDCRVSEWVQQHGPEYDDINYAILRRMGEGPGELFMRSEHVPLPPIMRPAAGGEQQVFIRHFAMRQPAYEPWNASYGPYLYPRSRGVLSKQWLSQLKEDCGCTLWPDPEDPSPAVVAAARATPPERYLLAPPFLLGNWFSRGRFGYWNRALSPQGPQQVVGHLHYIPDTDTIVSKSVARMAAGQFDWLLAAATPASGPGFGGGGGSNLYLLMRGSRTTSMAPSLANSYAAGGGALGGGGGSCGGGGGALQAGSPHLVAYHPQLLADLAAAGSWRDYSALLVALATAAEAMGRVPVWPDMPCSAGWIADRGPDHASTLPLDIRTEWVPYGRRRSRLMCCWHMLLHESCVAGGRGMLSLEFAHWMAGARLQYPVEPGAHNTVGTLAPGTPAGYPQDVVGSSSSAGSDGAAAAAAVRPVPLPSGISASAAAAMSRELSWWGQHAAGGDGAAAAVAAAGAAEPADAAGDGAPGGGADARVLAGVSAEGGSSGGSSRTSDTGRSTIEAQRRRRFQVYSVAREEVVLAWGIRATFAHRVLYLRYPINVTFAPGTDAAWALSNTLNECRATNPQAIEDSLANKPFYNTTPTNLWVDYVPASIGGPGGAIRRSVPIPGYNVPEHHVLPPASDSGSSSSSSSSSGGGGGGPKNGNAEDMLIASGKNVQQQQTAVQLVERKRRAHR
ncbi:hypothetical protein HXX76_005869 [Chlamydomonas incerta]|uniref:Nucleotide-diphospho-sugar transferase domain-containing protein n=1 Tax=Chlamydomonas incerta TaxID=51695 RepID=A0A835T4G3_CHLIN|nr:hypothetical protein HXX76_005869 [Chlamydomonas incerta]|eukprot:KAG2437206.1 hypothetical protein HXX76_005869 [Chlamydomonas incerta]